MSYLLAIAVFALLAAAGGVARWLMALRFNVDFPMGTLAANLLGSLLAGIGAGAGWPSVVSIAAIGSFTTFSTLMLELHRDWSKGRQGAAIGYLLVSVVGGLTAAWLGLTLWSSI